MKMLETCNITRTLQDIIWVKIHIIACFVCLGSVLSDNMTGVKACELSRHPTNVTLIANYSDTQWLKCGACSREPIRYTWEYRRDFAHRPIIYDTQTDSGCAEDICDDGFLYCLTEVKFSRELPVSNKLRGFYACRATCQSGISVLSHTAYVSVQGPPQFSQHPASRNISHGDNITLSCTIKHDPKSAFVTWHRRSANQHGVDLHIRDPTEQTAASATGEYTTSSSIQLKGVTKREEIFCQAINRFGAVDSTVAFINIKEKPEIITDISVSDITPTYLTVSWSPAFNGYDPISATYIKWQPIGTISNDTDNTNNQTYRVMEVKTNGTTNVYLISDLYPATLYTIWIAVSNNQGVSNWSEPLIVNTMYTSPPAPEEVTAKCLHDMVNISWTHIPYGREYGEITQYIVTVKDIMANHETIKKTSSHTNYIPVHRSLSAVLYNISVQGVTQGGMGSAQRIKYQCKVHNSTQVTLGVSTTEIMTPDYATNSTTEMNDYETTNTFGTTEDAFLITKLIRSPNGFKSSSNTNLNYLHTNYMPIVIIALSIVIFVLVVTLISYKMAKKKRRKYTQHGEPYAVYTARPNRQESANKDTEEESGDQDDPIMIQVPQQQQTNHYQTHIVNLVGQHADESDQFPEGACGGLGRSRLLRLASNDSEYENSIANYAHQINLDESSRQHFYEALIPIEQITTGGVIGEGEFGTVTRGYLDRGVNKPVKVAVKRMKDITDSKAYETFIKEGVITKGFDHPNVLAITGISLDEDISGCLVPLVVMPYMENGDLRTYLYNARVERNVWLSLYQLCGFMMDIAAGMEYLASKKFVHRDLAARNCMLDSSLTVKIADFGLTRSMCDTDYYRMRKDVGKSCKIPVKWVAIESLRDGKFNTNSDVWAYGVTIWEIITQSQIPYPGISSCNLYQYLLEGNRLARPQECPAELYDIMQSCWYAVEHHRPSFTTLKANLLKLLLDWKTKDIDGELQHTDYTPMSRLVH